MADKESKKPDVFVYQALPDLLNMSLAEIEALWELVPTERQREYKKIYDRTSRDEGASMSDALEMKMVSQLLSKYAEKGLVPIGVYWVPTPRKIQEAASSNTEVLRPEFQDAAQGKKLSKAIVLLGLGCFLVFAFMFLHNLGASSGRVTATLNVTTTPTPSATPVHSPTPTPLALDAQDSIIRSGDNTNSSSTLFPVNLRVILGDEVQPRIFVVQRKIIQTTEWVFDNNPDTASYIAGLTVRPVLGIPYTPENAALFDAMSAPTTFVLQMNTGASLHFQFVSRSTVNRSDTSAFRQTGPGLVLALIGERDPDTNEATPDRVIVLASYAPDQELSSGVLSGIALPKVDTPTPTLSPTPIQRMDVQLISVETSDGRATVRLRIFNGRSTSATIDEQSIWLVYGYVPRPIGPHVAANITAFDLAVGQAVDLTLNFAWHGEPFATLGILQDYQFAIAFHGGSS